MNSTLLGDSTAGHRLTSVVLPVAGIILVALLIELYIGMNLIHIPYFSPEYSHLIRDTLTTFVRLTGVALAVVYGVVAMR